MTAQLAYAAGHWGEKLASYNYVAMIPLQNNVLWLARTYWYTRLYAAAYTTASSPGDTALNTRLQRLTAQRRAVCRQLASRRHVTTAAIMLSQRHVLHACRHTYCDMPTLALVIINITA